MIIGVPKSDSDVTKTSSAPVASDGTMSGTITVSATRTGRRPRLMAASSMLWSTVRSPALTSRNTNGSACSVNTSTMPLTP